MLCLALSREPIKFTNADLLLSLSLNLIGGLERLCGAPTDAEEALYGVSIKGWCCDAIRSLFVSGELTTDGALDKDSTLSRESVDPYRLSNDPLRVGRIFRRNEAFSAIWLTRLSRSATFPDATVACWLLYRSTGSVGSIGLTSIVVDSKSIRKQAPWRSRCSKKNFDSWQHIFIHVCPDNDFQCVITGSVTLCSVYVG